MAVWGEGEGSGGVMTHDAKFLGQPSHATAIPCMQSLVRTYRLVDPFYPLIGSAILANKRYEQIDLIKWQNHDA